GVHVYFGGATGVTKKPVVEAPDGANGNFGMDVRGAGDYNNDGYADVVVGAPFAPMPNPPGKAYLYLGSATGLAATPKASWTGDANGDFMGYAVGGGDLDGDGFSDVFSGELGHTSFNGRQLIFAGSAGTPAATASKTLDSPDTGGQFGCSVN